MLAQVRGIHHGKSIAVLGSGPSVHLFRRKEDVVIGVNGAGSLLQKGDYLFSQDERAYMRSWFLDLPCGIACVLKPTAAMYSEWFYPDETVRKRLIGFFEDYMRKNPSEVYVKEDGFRVVKPGNPIIDAFQAAFPLPQPPHLILRKLVYEQEISRDMNALIKKGTSACGATQLAYVMGADSIHLYGVQFTNDAAGNPNSYTGANYFYCPKEGEKGRTTSEQMEIMDGIIATIIGLGTPVYSYGYTRLQNTIKARESHQVFMPMESVA